MSEQQYYAHPQNAFWPIMKEIFEVSGSYDERCEGLVRRKVAVWDVLRASVRTGSMDADIRQETASANDFGTFLNDHPRIRGIAFNGRKAEQLFRNLVSIELVSHLRLIAMPSTSPAYAAMSFAGKLELWKSGMHWLRANN